MNFKSLFLLGVFVVLHQNSFGKSDSLKVNKKRVFIVGSSLVVALGGSYWHIQNSWWAEKQIPFHFERNLRKM